MHKTGPGSSPSVQRIPLLQRAQQWRKCPWLPTLLSWLQLVALSRGFGKILPTLRATTGTTSSLTMTTPSARAERHKPQRERPYAQFTPQQHPSQ